MTKNNTKRALLMSALSLLLCMSMLVGTTFAWFTDTASTGVNTIISGNLDIVLEYWDGEEWLEVDTDTLLFNNEALWEPGYTEAAYLRIRNAGNLVLKYKVSVDVANEVPGKNMAGEVFYLSDYIEFGVVTSDSEITPYADRNAAQEAVAGSTTKLETYSENDVVLTPGQAKYMSLVLFMPTTVGNEANHDGKNAPSINLGVNVFATQKDSENDSYGPDYDKDATYSVGTPEQLVNAIADAKDGDIIKLENNIVLPETEVSGDKEIIVDLAGNTLFLGDAEKNADGFVVNDGATVNFINSSTEKTTIEYLGTNTRYDAIFVDKGALNIGGNIDVVVSPEASSAIHAVGENAVVNIGEGTNIIVEGETDGQFAAIYIERGAVVNMTGGTVTVASNLTKEDDGWNNDAVGVVILGSDCEFNMTGGTINVHSKNAMAQGIQIATYNGNGDSVANISGGTFNVTNEGTQGGAYAFALYETDKGTINISDVTFSGAGMNAIMYAYGDPAEADINITGGTYAFDPSVYVAAGCVVTESNGTWTVEQMYVMDGDNITISTANGLTYFADAVNNKETTFTGKTIVLTSDIDLAGIEWTPINGWEGILNGTVIDGNGHSILNMTVSSGDSVGFISNNASSITIKNLTFDGASVKSTDGSSKYAGVVMGKNYSNVTLENITVKNSQVRCTWQCGGLVGFAEGNAPVFINCTIQDSFLGGANCTAGALFGLGGVDVTATDCTASNVDMYTDMGPGLVGYLYGKTLTETNCKLDNVNVVTDYPAN